MVPFIFEGATAQFPAKLYLYILNPLSKNKEAAISYLEYVCQNRDLAEQALLTVAVTQGVLQPQSQSLLATLENNLLKNELTYESLSPQGKKESEAQNAQWRAEIVDIKEAPKSWLIYEPALQLYQNHIVSHLNLQLSPFLSDQHAIHSQIFPDMLTILKQYLGKTISLQQCIEKLNSISNMVHTENAGQIVFPSFHRSSFCLRIFSLPLRHGQSLAIIDSSGRKRSCFPCKNPPVPFVV